MDAFMNGFADELIKTAIDPYRAKALGIGSTKPPAAPASAPTIKAPRQSTSIPAPTLSGFKPGQGVPNKPKPPPAAPRGVDAPKGFRPPGVPDSRVGEGAKRLAKARAVQRSTPAGAPDRFKPGGNDSRPPVSVARDHAGVIGGLGQEIADAAGKQRASPGSIDLSKSKPRRRVAKKKAPAPSQAEGNREIAEMEKMSPAKKRSANVSAVPSASPKPPPRAAAGRTIGSVGALANRRTRNLPSNTKRIAMKPSPGATEGFAGVSGAQATPGRGQVSQAAGNRGRIAGNFAGSRGKSGVADSVQDKIKAFKEKWQRRATGRG